MYMFTCSLKQKNSLQSQLDDQFALRDIIDSKIKDLNKKKDIMMGLYSEDVEKSNNKFLQLSYHKKFVIRNSFLTDLLEISHFKAIYHFSIVIVIFACLFIFQDKINYTFIRFLVNEYTIFNVIKVSAVMQVFTTIFIYHGLKFWLMSRSKNSNPDYYDYFWLITYVLYLILHMTLLPMYLSVHYFGMFKMLMFIYMILLAIKMHAFVRENLYKGFLNFDQDRKLCDLKHFIYFLMIPTLIYQDNYPRLKCINWISVIKETIQVLIGLILVNYLYFYYIYNNMHNYVYHKSHSLSYLLGKNFVPSCAILFMGFYVHQHAFLNLIAELTLFGDKLFYKV
ncbi:hypothetical protein A3Q56_04236 [Intoshia linei]|uniref:Uncharacterized protein n=1 Tax=Intoshia linei TaxID=1819745 RepID=A0A177B174_9BILA|nr:hypothetical protein A3Q56_04236 [Intoshia linei]